MVCRRNSPGMPLPQRLCVHALPVAMPARNGQSGQRPSQAAPLQAASLSQDHVTLHSPKRQCYAITRSDQRLRRLAHERSEKMTIRCSGSCSALHLYLLGLRQLHCSMRCARMAYISHESNQQGFTDACTSSQNGGFLRRARQWVHQSLYKPIRHT